MDFKKVFDQTVRDIKREVNLKVLKVPEIEQMVLDATDNEPWGPHGSALAEIAQATKNFAECHMVMDVLWTRLIQIGKDWRYVYKALTVIEYLVAHGSERAIEDIIEHTFQISSLSGFEYVEPNGKDSGINVRMKAETITGLLNNNDTIQEVRNKAAANSDKFVGFSSTGISYKSSSTSYRSCSCQSGDSYGGLSCKRDGDWFKDSYRDRDQCEEEKNDKDTYSRMCRGATSEKQGSILTKDLKNYGSSIPAQSSSQPLSNAEDDFYDFDPRGTSNIKSARSSNQVHLFGGSLIGDLMDALTPTLSKNSAMHRSSSEVDLFADVTFVSAPPQVETKTSSQIEVDLFADATFLSAPHQAKNGANSQTKIEVDLFGSQPTMSSSASSKVESFAAFYTVPQPETRSTNVAPTNSNTMDRFAVVPLNNFDDSDPFGTFTSHSDSAPSEPSKNSVNNSSQSQLSGNLSLDLHSARKNTFQVKSGIWADSLSRGLIDLDMSTPKKVTLVDVGVVGGLGDGFDESKERPLSSYYMGKAMGSGSRQSWISSSQAAGAKDFFSSLSDQQ